MEHRSPFHPFKLKKKIQSELNPPVNATGDGVENNIQVRDTMALSHKVEKRGRLSQSGPKSEQDNGYEREKNMCAHKRPALTRQGRCGTARTISTRARGCTTLRS